MKIQLFPIKETDKEIQERLNKLAGDIGHPDDIHPLTLDAQTAMNELTNHLLGDHYYIVEPVSNIQANYIIVRDIESIYKNKRKPKKYRFTLIIGKDE